ncbi:site-specific DNA-methyltransferase [Paenibacillus spiritus]|uniref:Methyltransferase n=1 Tax=Paenibacillus spiritus TaxID=2496557 RepID=A0A5J5GGG4_9BACL|nr:site-specific DNA-methyltransferase [Paenibacillus spiritus]KAA9007241.1 site-specific DNA-methyltransferase [Paenibacillus spiritus]
MSTVPDNTFDLIIADPPYNRAVAKWDKYSNEEYLDLLRIWIKEFSRVLTPKGNLFIYNQQPMASYMFQMLYENLNFVDEIIWFYRNGGGNTKKKCKNVHQLLYWFTKTDNYIRNFDEVRQEYSGTRALYKHNVDKNPAKVWTPNDKGAMPTNVWEVSIVRQKEATALAKIGVQKPLEVSNRIIKLGSNYDSKIFIPFGGSGSEIESAIINNRSWVATEINLKYIEEIIEPRINEYLLIK